MCAVAAGRATTRASKAALPRPGRWMNVLRRIRSDDAGVGYLAGDATPAVRLQRQRARHTFSGQTAERTGNPVGAKRQAGICRCHATAYYL